MVRTKVKLDPTRTGNDAAKLHSSLQRLVVGQEQPIAQIVDIYQTWMAGMTDPGRPIGSFLFLGPTGTGKTRLVEATAESLLGDPRAVVKVDCGEFQQSHEIAKLIGSPPGYLGHRETHAALSQEALNRYHSEATNVSFVLFDEIEKASDAVWNLLLGILDKGVLTLGDNRKVDFSTSMIFMTSNIGAADMEAMVRPKLGFASSEAETRRMSGESDEAMNEKMSRVGVEAMRRKFTPEFVNRIDKIAVFKPLDRKALASVLNIELNRLQNRILTSSNAASFVLNVDAAAREYLLQEGTDMKYGARHLKRAIERSVIHPLSNLLASEQLQRGDMVRIDYDPAAGCLTFMKEAEQIAGCSMARMIERPYESRAAAGAGVQSKWPRSANRKKEKTSRV
jgi:ATP-dependent Clp protease ATP-binding subunit ClpB